MIISIIEYHDNENNIDQSFIEELEIDAPETKAKNNNDNNYYLA